MVLGDPKPHVATIPIQPCRNCGGSEFYSRLVHARGGRGPDLLPIGFLRPRRFRIQVCGQCGLIEWFVPEDLLAAVKEKFPPLCVDESVETA
jgi:hypothetical protein